MSTSYLEHLPNTIAVERRKLCRYHISAPATFKWQYSDGSWHEAGGVTRDISGNGVFILTSAVPLPGALIDIVVKMPGLGGDRVAVPLHGLGTVLRAQRAGDEPWGFAADIVFHPEKSNDPRPAEAVAEGRNSS